MGLPRYEDPAGIVVGTVILQVLSLVCVGLRFYSRRWKRQDYIVSDWLILVALLFGIGLSVGEIYGEPCLHITPKTCHKPRLLVDIAMLIQGRCHPKGLRVPPWRYDGGFNRR
jgi:hypothetical protein